MAIPGSLCVVKNGTYEQLFFTSRSCWRSFSRRCDSKWKQHNMPLSQCTPHDSATITDLKTAVSQDKVGVSLQVTRSVRSVLLLR